MTTTVQKTIYFPEDIVRIIRGIENSYFISKGGMEDPSDGFINFTTLLINYFSLSNGKHSYLYEHIKAYAETTRNILGNKCNEMAFDAVAKAFDFYGRDY